MSFGDLSHDEWVDKLNRGEISAKQLIEFVIAENITFIWHPLGFIMCKISNEDKKIIRLHIWPDNKCCIQKPTWLIHDHFFDLKSWVLKGTITNIEYIVGEFDNSFQVYNTIYEKDKSILIKTKQRLSILESKRYLIKEGESYDVYAGQLHKSISSSNTTVTICETVNQFNLKPRVLGACSGRDRYSYTRNVVSKVELEAITNKI